MNKRLLVCDLDNTLYDWVGYFVPAFYSMVDEAVRITNCDRELLLDSFRDVHRRHHDAEHPFSLLETQTINDIYRGWRRKDVALALDSAFHSFNSSRKRNLHLYPGVRAGLDVLSRSDIVLVAHTESKLFAVADRLKRLDLASYFRRVYCRERPKTAHPDPEVANDWLGGFPVEKIVELSHHQRKPDPTVLLEICRKEDVRPEDTAYVGDSMARDMLMAKTAGVTAIWAKYGSFHEPEEYEKLVRVSHWTSEDVAREKELRERASGIDVDHTLECSFQDIVDVLTHPSQQAFAGR